MARKFFIPLLGLALVGALAATSPIAAQPILCDGQVATIVGTPGDDRITGTPGDDVIFGAQGDDFITASGGDDIICAGQGDDVVHGGMGFDIIFGAQGNDELFGNSRVFNLRSTSEDERGARIFGGAGDDLIFGTDRWDRMQGGPGEDRLFGLEGRDWIRGGPGRDEVNGGAGIDDVHGGNGSDRVTVTNGDTVRGGAGLDWCVITGPAELLRSCGVNRYEAGTAAISVAAGSYNVPVDIPFGFYRTTELPRLIDSEGGNVGRIGGPDGEGPRTVNVHSGVDFATFGEPGTRVEASGPINALALRDGGRVLVGMDIAPGTYEASDPGSFVRMVIYDGVDDFLDVEIAEDFAVMVIPPEAVFLEFDGTLRRLD